MPEKNLIIQLTSQNFETQVLKNKGLIVIDFWAPWCQPCLRLSPIFDQLAKEYQDRVKFAKLNVDENQEIAQKYGVMSIPTTMFFDQGQPINQLVGVRPALVYKREIENLLNLTPEQKKKRQEKKEIIVFSTPSCPWCRRLKTYLKERGIQFKDVDVSTDQAAAQAMVAKSGQMGVPQAWINSQVVVGFDKPRVDALLGLS